MKRILLFFLLLISLKSFSQSEFAATAFYNDIKKIYEDGQSGFVKYKGAKLPSEYEDLQDEYKAKLVLPLADSGKIIFPVTGKPYTIYFFEPSKSRLKVDQRGADLRDAVVQAFGKPLFARSESTLVNEHPITNTWYYTEASDNQKANAVFRMSIYYKMGKYYLSLEIIGKNP